MASEGPRHAEVTLFDHGPLIQIPAWFFMVVSVLVTFLKIAVRFKATRNPGLDDAVCFFAMLLGVGQTIAISLAVNDGLGRSSSIRDISLTSNVQKNIYASDILYILTLAVAKIAALIFITRLAVSKVHSILTRTSIGLVSLWGVAAVFAFAFQCGLSQPWSSRKAQCFDLVPFWIIIGIADILTDLLTIVIPQWLVWNLQMSKAKKTVVTIAFGFRIPVVIAAIARLVYLKQLQNSSDYFFDYPAVSTCTQCQMALSLIATCLPSLKPFLDRTASGMLNASIAPRSGTTYGLNSHNEYHMGQLSNSKWSMRRADSKGPVSKISQDPKDYSQIESFRPEQGNHNVVITSGKDQPRDGGRDDMASLESSGSDKMIIRLRKDLSIHYSDEQPQRDNASSGAVSEHVHHDSVHALSTV